MTGVECSSAQLFRTGLVHADPHEGNMMYTDDGKLALLDFGLVCRVNNDQQEAMAGCILNVLNRDRAAEARRDDVVTTSGTFFKTFQRAEFVFSGNECSPNNEHEHEQLGVRVRVRFSAGQVYCSLFVFVSVRREISTSKNTRRRGGFLIRARGASSEAGAPGSCS